MSHSLEELEQILGDPVDFMLGPHDPPLLRQWAIARGYDRMKVAGMSNIDLANLYHAQEEPGKIASDTARDLHAMFINILNAVQVPGFNADLTREITAEHVQSPEMRMIYEDAARRVFDTLPPRRVEFVTAGGSFITDTLQHHMTETIGRITYLGHPVMLVGPAGCGKTTIAETVARVLQLPFYITSTINDTHELTGFVDGYGNYHATPFRKAFETGGVWVADEIDAWDASALLAANSALANGFANFPDAPDPVRRHPNFRMIATANTFGNGADRVYIGRNELDAASLDRFAMISVDYDEQLERMFANGNNDWLQRVWQIRAKVQRHRIRHVVSSRAITMGGAALAAGLDRATVEEVYLFKGLSESDREKLS